MKDAGLPHGKAEQSVNDGEKQQLLAYLKRSHGDRVAEPQKITLKRKSVSQIKVSNSQGKSKTVSVEVRKKRTYMKRSLVEGEAPGAEDEEHGYEGDEQLETAVQSQEEAARQEQERKHAEEQARREEEERKAAAAAEAARKEEAAKMALLSPEAQKQ